jgi:anion-transporting  ArsA/GET3 family ATPase
MMIDRAIQEKRIIITGGTGGVGKTTLSAAIALRATILGKKTVVITIDPAKRLATSLGLDTLGDHPTDLTPLVKQAFEKAKTSGSELPERLTGSLAAIMPDTKKTFETFIETLSTSKETTNRVIQNPIFQIFAKEFSGTNEYMALQRLYALDLQHKYDCIILDTPPSRNTLGFLDAPKLLARFFEERLIRWLVLPANRLFSGGMKKALGILEKLTGAGFMMALFDFASALFEVRASFSENLKKITKLLESKDVGFILVATPSPDTAREAAHFVESLSKHNLHFEGVAINRTLSYLPLTEQERQIAHTKGASNPELHSALAIIEALQRREERAIDDILKRVANVLEKNQTSGSQPDQLYAKLPELARDVHSVEDLFHVAMVLNRT